MPLIKLIRFSVFLLLSISLSSKAQAPLSLYFLENIPQSSFSNPALSPQAKVYVGLPGLNSVFINYNSNLSLNYLLQTKESGSISILNKSYDYKDIYNAIGEKAKLSSQVEIRPIIFGFKVSDKGYFSFSSAIKYKAEMHLPKDFFSIMEKGFPDGSHYNLSDLFFETQAYQEYSLSYSHCFFDRLQIGVRAKYLQGLFALKTDVKNIHLNTSKTQWDIISEGQIYSSGPLAVHHQSNDKIDSIRLTKSIEDFDTQAIINDYLLNLSNNGIGMDLGVAYQINSQWSVFGSVNELGFIHWQEHLNSLHFKGAYSFDGLDINNSNVDSLDTENGPIQELIDSVKAQINYRVQRADFKSSLNPYLTIGGQHYINEKISFGVLYRMNFYSHNTQENELNLSGQFNWSSILSTSLNYSTNLSGERHLGMALGLRASIIQFYIAFDNIPIVFDKYKIDNNSFLVPHQHKLFRLMFGFNLLFGNKDKKNKRDKQIQD